MLHACPNKCVVGVLFQGNCLLVGVGGSGKQSLARLAAFAAGCGVFEITLTRGYDEAAFREDLKKLYALLGSENKKTVFLFTDSHVADEGFLELINNMLTTGGCFVCIDKWQSSYSNNGGGMLYLWLCGMFAHIELHAC